MTKKMKYRPDIDGLRAIAVLSVLFYHAELNLFSGGYIGVDVFFVISGFLITKKILIELKDNAFSLVTFYESRIRRIFPALFVVIIFTLFVGAWLFEAKFTSRLAQSANATSLFWSNIHFLSPEGYFKTPSKLKPFLHMWSLSVEEQFYLIFPLLFTLLFRFIKDRLVAVLTFIGLVSFGFGVYVLNKEPSAAFYLAHLRAWEFLLGGIIAITSFKLKPKLYNIFSLSGIFMILISVVLFSDETLFPGFSAVLPVLGTVFIIYSGLYENTLVGKILSVKPLVYIGKISYSLYLWHWPLIVFVRYLLIREITTLEILIWVGVTVVVSSLSWKFIESPFRSKTFFKKAHIFILAVSTVYLVSHWGYYLDSNENFPERLGYNKEGLPPSSVWNYEWDEWKKCIKGIDASQIGESDLCILGDTYQTPSFFVWGDSHAIALATAINKSALDANKAGYIIALNACPPLLGIDREVDPAGGCFNSNNIVVEYIRSHPEIETVILVGRWSLSSEGSRYKREEGLTVNLVDMEAEGNQNFTNASLFELGMRRTVQKIKSLNREVVIISSVPELGYYLPRTYSIALRTDRDINDLVAPTLEDYMVRNRIVISVLDKLEKQVEHIKILDPSSILCNEQRCPVVVDGKPLYSDDDHLSTFGSFYISDLFNPIFQTF